MKKHIIILINLLLIVSGLFFYKHTSAQNRKNIERTQNEVYWFFIKIKENINSETGYAGYKIVKKPSKIHQGIIKKFVRKLWQNLSRGSKFAIGPFNSYKGAQESSFFYQFEEKEISLFDSNLKVFWFIIPLKHKTRQHTPYLQRLPQATASGTYNDFYTFLKDNLKMHVMAIGPFSTIEEAEEAKRTYRLH